MIKKQENNKNFDYVMLLKYYVYLKLPRFFKLTLNIPSMNKKENDKDIQKYLFSLAYYKN